MAKWYTVSCQECGCDIQACEEWDRAPKFCKSCKEEFAAKWYEKRCEDCGTTMKVCTEWDHPPKFCKNCKERNAAKWYDKRCEECGLSMKVCTEWDHPPKFCPRCKKKNADKWYDKRCEECGTTMKACTEWDHPPKFCKSCKKKNADKWYEKSCEICGSKMKVCKDWDHAPNFCQSCKKSHAAKEVACSECGKRFPVSTGLQLKCKKNGWNLPSRCTQCKDDSLLIKGAIGALRDKFPFALETTIEPRGLIFKDKVAIVKNRKTGEVVAEVTMNEEGFLFWQKRVAVAADKATGKTVSKTREGQAGFIFIERTADTYEANLGTHTHRTTNVEKGIFFPEVVAETKRTDGSAEKTVTRTEQHGGLLSWLFGKQIRKVTDKE